jgi:hypothetical protein
MMHSISFFEIWAKKNSRYILKLGAANFVTFSGHNGGCIRTKQLLLFAVFLFTNAEVLIVLSTLRLLKTNIVHTLVKTS